MAWSAAVICTMVEAAWVGLAVGLGGGSALWQLAGHKNGAKKTGPNSKMMMSCGKLTHDATAATPQNQKGIPEAQGIVLSSHYSDQHAPSRHLRETCASMPLCSAASHLLFRWPLIPLRPSRMGLPCRLIMCLRRQHSPLAVDSAPAPRQRVAVVRRKRRHQLARPRATFCRP